MKQYGAVIIATLLLAAGAAGAKEVQVSIKDHAFIPAILSIQAGDTVIWTNHDQDPHNAIEKSAARVFHSPALDTQETYAFTFTKPGAYEYFCSFHPIMVGHISVVAP